MRTITLPGGESVPVLGIGTWNMGERRHKRAEEIAALREAVDLGMTVVDTAEMYGSGAAEELIAEALGHVRDRIFLVSKVLPQHASTRGTIAACEASLKRWCDKGLLPAQHTPGGHRRILMSDVFQFLKQTSHQLVEPEVLGLPATIGRTDRVLERAAEQFQDAVLAGDETRKKLPLFLRGAIRPVEHGAEAKAAAIGTGVPWSQMRSEAGRNMAYIAPVKRGTRIVQRKRKNFANRLIKRAMEPALDANREQVGRAVDEGLFREGTDAAARSLGARLREGASRDLQRLEVELLFRLAIPGARSALHEALADEDVEVALRVEIAERLHGSGVLDRARDARAALERLRAREPDLADRIDRLLAAIRGIREDPAATAEPEEVRASPGKPPEKPRKRRSASRVNLILAVATIAAVALLWKRR